jgi:hypothetical protein
MPIDASPSCAAYATPFGALRCAQLQTLGLDPAAASTVAPLLLPPLPCADAGEEQFLLAAARFLVEQKVIVREHPAHDAELRRCGFRSSDTWFELAGERDVPVRMADLAFFFEARLRDAEQQGQPLCEAFSFSGRTADSVLRLAVNHRREALVDAVAGEGAPAAAGRRALSPWSQERERFGGLELTGTHRRHLPAFQLSWDAECSRMLQQRVDAADGAQACPFDGDDAASMTATCGSIDLDLPDMRWDAVVNCEYAGGMDGQLAGHWHMKQLRTKRQLRREGEAQKNCLRSFPESLYFDEDCSYWSLRFTPDAAALESASTRCTRRRELKRFARSLRLTVCINERQVEEAKAKHNEDAEPAAVKALLHWGHQCDVAFDASYYYDDSSDDGEADQDG